jgi:hypothetical protein
MKIIKLTESQYHKIFESISDLKDGMQSDLTEFPGSSESMSMITVPVDNSDGEIENGKPMNTGSDKISKTMTIQTPWNSRKSSYHN